MIDTRLHGHRWCLAGVLFGLLGMAGCGAEKVPDFCKNHGQFHDSHRDELGSLSILMTAEGHLRSELILPIAALGATPAASLDDVTRVYSLQTATDCATPSAKTSVQNDRLFASYESNCGADNKIGQFDVRIFDSLPLLEEIEVDITTPVAKKHFFINRQCESAIFRIKKL